MMMVIRKTCKAFVWVVGILYWMDMDWTGQHYCGKSYWVEWEILFFQPYTYPEKSLRRDAQDNGKRWPLGIFGGLKTKIYSYILYINIYTNVYQILVHYMIIFYIWDVDELVEKLVNKIGGRLMWANVCRWCFSFYFYSLPANSPIFFCQIYWNG